MLKKLPLRLVAAILLFFPGYQGKTQNFGEAGSYGLKPSSGLVAEANTNLATGLIAPSVPLLSLPGVAGGIAVGLQYQAGAGIKVNATASEVGLGWALTGGGAIVREVRGFADDSQYGWIIDLGGNSYHEKYWETGPNLRYMPLRTAGDVVRYFKSRTGNVDQVPSGTSYYGAGWEDNRLRTWLYPASQAASYGQYSNHSTYIPYGQPNSQNNFEARWSGVFFPDNEPDVYTLTLPTGTLQFVFDPNGNAVPLQAQSIKIEALNLGAKAYNATGILHEFRVTTSDGVNYYFGSPAQSTNCKEHVQVETRVLEMANLGSKNDLPSYISKWHLRQIVYPSGEKIEYTYSADKTYEVSTNNYLQQNWVFTALNGLRNTSQNRGHAWRALDWQRRYTVRTSLASTDTKQLVSIASTQGTLQFAYQATPRRDVGGTTNALAAIRLLNTRGELVRRLDFIQHYADYGQTVPNAMPYDRYHLLLDRIVDKGNGCDYTNLWQFGYDPHTFCRNTATKDYWGYLNGLAYPADGTLVAAYARPLAATNYYAFTGRDRSPNAGFTQYMLLQSITSATGGVQSFTYQLNDASIGSAIQTVGGLRIYRIAKYDGVDHANDIVDEFSYRKASSPNESSGYWGDAGMYEKLQLIHDDVDNTSSAPIPIVTDASLRGIFPNCYNSGYGNTHSRADYYYLLRSDASMYEYATDYIDYSCVTVSHGSKGKTRYEFTGWADATHRDYTDPDTRQVGNTLNTCPGDPLNPTYRGAVLDLPFSLEVDGLSLLSAANGNPVYTPGISADFPRRSSRSAERGLLLQTTQLTSANVIVAATINEYYYTHPTVVLPTVNAVYVKPSLEAFGFSQFFTYFQLYYYNVASQWCALKSSTEIIYNQESGGDIAKSVATKTLIEYDVSFLPSKITKYTTTCSSPALAACQSAALGDYQVTEFRRAQAPGFPDGAATGNPDLVTTPALLRNAGMTALVIEQRQYTTATLTGTPVNHLGASLNLYQLSNGHVVPYQTYTSPAGGSFTPATTAQPVGNWVLSRDGSYQLVSTVNGYTADALPVNSVGRDGIPTATIWGYGHALPIAQVSNGSATTGSTGDGLLATAGHTSFEENGADGDDWDVPPGYSNEAKTGAYSARFPASNNYGLNKKLVLRPANQHGKLIFSCWAKVPKTSGAAATFSLVAASPAPISGYKASPGFQVSPGEDWKYCEFSINPEDAVWGNMAASDQNLSLLLYLWKTSNSELLLDEVRLHPADAQMQTTTYQQLVGKTSDTGPDGRTSYFTYNSDGSPRLLLDHNRDVIYRNQSKRVNQSTVTAEFSPGHGYAQTPTNFVAGLDNCADAVGFVWDFGEGAAPATGSATMTHTYQTAGSYDVTLIAAHSSKGVGKLTKSITICDAYVQLNTEYGDSDVDYCQYPNGLQSVRLEAIATNDCSEPVSYQWQEQTGGSNSAWTNVPPDPNYPGTRYTFNVPCNRSISHRCIVTYADGTTSLNHQDIVTSTGTVSSAACQCPQ